MAGSYEHCVNGFGRLLAPKDLEQSLDNFGDVAEAIEELYGMIWALAGGSKARVEAARICYKDGLRLSPGVEGKPGCPARGYRNELCQLPADHDEPHVWRR